MMTPAIFSCASVVGVKAGIIGAFMGLVVGIPLALLFRAGLVVLVERLLPRRERSEQPAYKRQNSEGAVTLFEFFPMAIFFSGLWAGIRTGLICARVGIREGTIDSFIGLAVWGSPSRY